jgi:hypothetical protein
MWIDSDLFDDVDDVDDIDDTESTDDDALPDDPLADLADLADGDDLLPPNEGVTKPLSVLDLRKEFGQLRFSGGCDCSFTPATCGLAHFCRWQY